MEIGENFNMLEYLRSIKELWEAKSVYEQTVASLTNQYKKLGVPKVYNNVRYESFFAMFDEIDTELACFFWIIIPIILLILKIKAKIIICIFIVTFFLCILFSTILPNIDLKKQQKRINELRQKDAERVKREQEELKPPILEKINHYKMKIKEVENAINALYDFGIIHKDYQHYNAAVLFYNYMESKRCEDIRECMLKFDNDSEIMRMHEKVDLMNAKLDQLQKTTLHQLSSLRRSVESNISRTQNLIEQSQKQTQAQLDSLEYNVHINTLMTKEYIDELRHHN